MFVPTFHNLLVTIDTSRSKSFYTHIETYTKDCLTKSFQDDDIGWEVLNTQLVTPLLPWIKHSLIVRIDTSHSRVYIEPSGKGKNLHIETYIKDYLATSFQDDGIGWEVWNTQLLPCAAYSINGIKIEEGRQKK